MNSLIKIGVAGALALGASVAAHASIVVPSSSSTGDLILWADVFNGTTLVDAFAGDTGISVSGVTSTSAPAKFTNANLNTLLADATTGTTVVWGLQGGNGTSSGAPYMLSSVGTSVATAFGTGTDGSVLNGMGLGLTSEIRELNSFVDSTNSFQKNNDGTTALGGTGFNPTAQAADVYNWYGNTKSIAVTGLGTQAALYLLTAADTNGGTPVTFTDLLNATLTSTGLSFSTLSTTSPVPVPAAVWLLGSGLLGLAGVARRKASV